MKKIEVIVEKWESKDGLIWDTESDCIHHEKRLDGLIITCTNCKGKQNVDAFGDGSTFWECATCKGKGFLEKKEIWE